MATGLGSLLSGEEGGFADALPETIQQAVERRLERLSPGLRELLGVASVLGRSFELSDLEALVETPGQRIEGGLRGVQVLEQQRLAARQPGQGARQQLENERRRVAGALIVPSNSAAG